MRLTKRYRSAQFFLYMYKPSVRSTKPPSPEILCQQAEPTQSSTLIWSVIIYRERVIQSSGSAIASPEFHAFEEFGQALSPAAQALSPAAP